MFVRGRKIEKGREYKMTNLILKRQLAKNKKKGFTLIELIVVIVIIAIIAAIAVPALTRYIQSAEVRQVQATAHNIQVVLQAEKSELYSQVFAGTIAVPVASDVAAYPTGPSYEELLNMNGIYLTDMALTGIAWNGHTLNDFVLTKDGSNIVVTYNVVTGFVVGTPAP